MQLFQQIEAFPLFAAIRDSAYGYSVLLWIHIVALIVWVGAMLVSDQQAMGDASKGSRLRPLQYTSLSLAALTGILLFGAKAAYSASNSWLWTKLVLLAVFLLLRRFVLTREGRSPAMAIATTILFCTTLAWASRGPLTVNDMMHAMVDPTADGLFSSIQTISDNKGARMEGPKTPEQWQELERRLQVLVDVSELLRSPGLRAARVRDRSSSPVENEPAEVQRLMDANHADFVAKAARLNDAASVAMRAVKAQDTNGLWDALAGIDAACEVCHLRYWYPRDTRAVDAARENGLIE